jgi:hypothetical protein
MTPLPPGARHLRGFIVAASIMRAHVERTQSEMFKSAMDGIAKWLSGKANFGPTISIEWSFYSR